MNTFPNPSITDQTNQDAVAEQAMAWFARLRADDVTTEQRVQFVVWLEIEPQHKQAYQNVEAFWQHPDFTEVLAAAKLSTPTKTAKAARHRWRYSAILAMAACLLLMVTLFRPALNCWQADFCTVIGEIRTVQLADGSQITLNSNTALNVNLQGNLRHIQLLHGEALFEVQRNPEQPFVVASRYATTRVLGTRFLVRQGQQADTITVISGVVEVSGKQHPPEQLRANEQIAANPQSLSPIQQVTASNAVAWVKGHALFDNVPLRDVLAELSRYRHGTMLVTNPQLNTLKVSGRFDIADTDHALQALQQTLPIRIAPISPWLVVVY